MKLMIASDIHGSLYYCAKLEELYRKEEADKLILLGDLLYHGPRNDLPMAYNPRGVIQILNSLKSELLCVRGNCDSEVDQMVLDFPIMCESALVMLEDRTLFLTHGHTYNEKNLPPLKLGDVLLNGHTHVPALREEEDYIYLNPGSISLPKEGSANSYMLYEDGIFTLKNVEQDIVAQLEI